MQTARTPASQAKPPCIRRVCSSANRTFLPPVAHPKPPPSPLRVVLPVRENKKTKPARATVDPPAGHKHASRLTLHPQQRRGTLNPDRQARSAETVVKTTTPATPATLRLRLQSSRSFVLFTLGGRATVSDSKRRTSEELTSSAQARAHATAAAAQACAYRTERYR